MPYRRWRTAHTDLCAREVTAHEKYERFNPHSSV